MSRVARWSPALSKEIRALFPLWAATAVALAAGFVSRWWNLPDVGLFAYVAGSGAIGAHSVGQEYSYRTLPILLSQPADRRRLYLIKFIVAAAMLLTLAVLALGVFAGAWGGVRWPMSLVILTPLLSLCLAPLMTMICRSSLAGIIVAGTMPALAWMATLAIAWFGFGVDPHAAGHLILGPWTLGVMLSCPLLALLGRRRFITLETADGTSPALHLPRWLRDARGVRRHAPWRATASKEIHLQQLTFVIAGLYVVGWAALLLAQRYIPSWSSFPVGAAMLMYCLGLAITIGALASAEERQHGTLDSQLLQPAPGWQQWMVKIGVTFGLSLACGVALPLVLNQLTPLEGFRPTRVSADLAVLVVLLTAGSIYISSLSSSGVRAMALSLPAGMAVAYFVQIVSGALHWAALKLAGPATANALLGATAPSSLVFTGRTFALTLVPLLLWFGFVNHRSLDRPARRVVQQVAAIALVIGAGIILLGGGLALYGSR